MQQVVRCKPQLTNKETGQSVDVSIRSIWRPHRKPFRIRHELSSCPPAAASKRKPVLNPPLFG